MTRGILISRNTKKALHKSSIAFPTAANVQKYKNYKTIYQRVLRGAKKLYFTSKLEENAKNPKKTWETLNEALGKDKKNQTVEKININGTLSNNQGDIANHFNSFFTQIGKNISNSIPPIKKNPRI